MHGHQGLRYVNPAWLEFDHIAGFKIIMEGRRAQCEIFQTQKKHQSYSVLLENKPGVDDF